MWHHTFRVVLAILLVSGVFTDLRAARLIEYTIGGQPIITSPCYYCTGCGNFGAHLCCVAPFTCTPRTYSGDNYGPAFVVGCGFACHLGGMITGYMANLSAEFDGVRVPNDLLPSTSQWQFGIALRQQPFVCDSACGACHVAYYIEGYGTGSWTVGEAVYPVVSTTDATDGLAFDFDTCDFGLNWGTTDGVGSVDLRWRLYLPDGSDAFNFAAGDPAPHGFPRSGVSIDFASTLGGIVTSASLAGPPPGNSCGVEFIPRYWDLRTGMPSGTFLADLTVAYNAAEIPVGVEESALKLWRYSRPAGVWEAVPTVLDTLNHTATAPGVTELSMVAVGAPGPTPPGSTTLQVTPTELFWNLMQEATAYDVVTGDLILLHLNMGDYSQATLECLADNSPSTVLSHSTVSPSERNGNWFLVRGVNPAGPGTYDDCTSFQVGQRDSEIQMSPDACP